MKKSGVAFLLSLGLSTVLLGGERDDLSYLDELYKQKRYETAVNESERFLETYPTSRYANSVEERLGKTYFILGKYNDSIKHFEQVIPDKGSKNVDEINYYLTRAYAMVGNKKQSDYCLLMIDRKSDYYVRAIYDTGMYYVAKDDYAGAKDKLQEVMLGGDRYAKEALLGMALVSYNTGKYSEALSYLGNYGEPKAGDKNASLVNYIYGSTYYKQNDLGGSLTYFQKVISRDTSSEYGKKSLMSVVDIYASRGDTANLDNYLNRIKNPKDKAEVLSSIGDSYVNKGDYTTALKYYGMSPSQKDLQTIYGQGYSLYKLNRFQEAKTYFDRLKGTSYEGKAIYYSFATDYKLGKYSEIVQKRDTVKKYKLSKEDRDNINLIIANSAYETKNYDIAYSFYKSSYAQDPSLDNLYRIFAIAARNNDFDEMSRRYNEYIKKFPNDTSYKKRISLAMGDAYYKKNKKDEAIATYKEYLKYGKDEGALNNMISMLLNNQNYTELLDYLNKAESTPDNDYLKAIANIGIGNYQTANELLDSVANNANTTEDLKTKVKFNKVRNYFLWEKYDDTIKSGNEYLAVEGAPDKSEVIDKVGISYFRLDKFAQSREEYTKLEEDPKSAEYAKFQIAETYYGEKDLAKARDAYKAVYDQYPSGEYGEKAYYWYLNTLANMGEMDTFNKEKDGFLSKYPNSEMKDNILILSGAVYENLKDNQKALEYYKDLYSTTKNNSIRDNAAERILEILLLNKNVKEAKEFTAKLENDELKSYYDSIINTTEGKSEEAFKQYQKLVNSKKYSDYANLNIGTYYYTKKDYPKAREYYNKVADLDSSVYKDVALYQISTIDEAEGKIEDAFRGYTKCYVMYNGRYYQLSKIRAAQMAEKLNRTNDALSLYKELYSLGNKLSYRDFVLEKLIVLNSKAGSKTEAKKYYEELNKINKETAKKYEQLFK